MTDNQFKALLDTAPGSLVIVKQLMAMRNKLHQYRRIAVSYSGGSDSDTILDMVELLRPDGADVRYVFFDTGLEWDATVRHIAEVEDRYRLIIERKKAKKPIPVACKEHGIPFISKDLSENLDRLQRHNFDWNDTEENATETKYGRCRSALDWWYDQRPPTKSGKTKFSVERYKLLRQYIMGCPPDFTISDKCCDYAKKNVSKDFEAEYRPDLKIDGMRMAEGGRRIGRVTSCFNDTVTPPIYHPLWFWTDKDKTEYKLWRRIVYSDCYEKWGFARTGCVGCPCTILSVPQLELAKEYEPHKVAAAYAVFGKSYEYRRKYIEFKLKGGKR